MALAQQIIDGNRTALGQGITQDISVLFWRLLLSCFLRQQMPVLVNNN